jgi:hypothetical protein
MRREENKTLKSSKNKENAATVADLKFACLFSCSSMDFDSPFGSFYLDLVPPIDIDLEHRKFLILCFLVDPRASELLRFCLEEEDFSPPVRVSSR